MKHIKLYVKEISEERRTLTFHEECMISIAYHTHRDTISHGVFVKCQQTLDDIGYIKSSYDERCRIATFRTETIREATPDEAEAWYYLKGVETGADNILGDASVKEAKQLLAGKEIYPEVVED